MTVVRHLVVGPAEHGVVRHAVDVALACDHALDQVSAPEYAADVSLAGVDVVHTAFTDRLFGRTCEDAAAAFGRLADHVRAARAELSVTLHDVPLGDSAFDRRRRTAYRAVVAAARGVVVNSLVELAAMEDDASGPHSVRCIALPAEPAVEREARRAPADRDVVVLGFVFPDRGYDEVLEALPPGSGLVAMGRPADGHEDLPARLADHAAELGRWWHLTGFVPDADLAGRLAAVAVPVAPNRRVGASGSINTWLAHGRRPLVPDTPYTREVDRRMPGLLVRYDPDRSDALGTAIRAALEDPASTWLPADARLVPSLDDVTRRYRAHLAACASARVIDRHGHAAPALVPGNRWDLVAPASGSSEPSISVVIPYYDDQRRLELILAALAAQSVAGRFDVVVADDGSPEPPDVSGVRVPVRVVRQPRDGFGAGRARNLGAAACDGEILVFLDGDTVPEPDYLRRLTDLPARHAGALTVGRRRHARFDGWSAHDVADWAAGRRTGPDALDEPQWLRTAYRDSRDLLDADPRSYRHVISAVLAMPRRLWDRLGGFDPRFTRYGGEDWELAHRAWQAGALLAHVPAAVAWHDGPDWGQRDAIDQASGKNAETLALAALLPDPELRGGGQWLPYPYAVVRIAFDDPAAVLATVRTAFASGADCGFWLTGPTGGATAAALADPRVEAGAPPPDVLARAAVLAEVAAPCDLASLPALCALAERRGLVRAPAVTLRAVRAVNRVAGEDPADRERLVELLFGRHDRSAPVPFDDVRLDAVLATLAPSVRRA